MNQRIIKSQISLRKVVALFMLLTLCSIEAAEAKMFGSELVPVIDSYGAPMSIPGPAKNTCYWVMERVTYFLWIETSRKTELVPCSPGVSTNPGYE